MDMATALAELGAATRPEEIRQAETLARLSPAARFILDV
jgi:hypothetical protein